MSTMIGKFVVLDGTDGSGKTVHTEMLQKRLTAEGLVVHSIDFPRYEAESAYFVKRYLNKEYGTPDEVGPYRASIFYALDRFEHAPIIRKWLNERCVVISNRYTSSNMGHQTGKIRGSAEREKFLNWLEDFEYRMLGIPKPDLHILLYMPPEIGQQLVDQKETLQQVGKRKRDAHEEDINHLKNASEAYLYVARKYSWPVVYCTEKSALRPLEVINEEIHRLFQEHGII